MRFLLLFAMVILAGSVYGQEKKFDVHPISLPSELSYYDNQFSGLQIANKKLYLMSECRLQDKREAKLYSIKLSDIEHHLKDTAYVLPFEKIMIMGLDSLALQMKEDGQEYEGLEAFVIDGEMIYFSVETTTPSPYCYLLKGKLDNDRVYLEQILQPISKPRLADDSPVYNAGFEAMALMDKHLFLFFEYNYFSSNHVYLFPTRTVVNSADILPISPVPFRITDITKKGNHHFTAINYFFKGEGADTVYRVPATDTITNALIKKGNSYRNYCRLIDIDYRRGHFTWKSLWTFPEEYTGYNWEGIAAYKKGYFILNDKYTLTRPYASVLLYVK